MILHSVFGSDSNILADTYYVQSGLYSGSLRQDENSELEKIDSFNQQVCLLLQA